MAVDVVVAIPVDAIDHEGQSDVRRDRSRHAPFSHLAVIVVNEVVHPSVEIVAEALADRVRPTHVRLFNAGK